MLKPALTLSALLLLGSSPAPSADTDALERGLEVYRAAYCGTCHTLSAAGAQGQFGPNHDHLLTAIQARLESGSYHGEARSVEEYLRESILTPDAYLDPVYAGSRYRMPAFTNLSSEDIDALVLLLEQP